MNVRLRAFLAAVASAFAAVGVLRAEPWAGPGGITPANHRFIQRTMKAMEASTAENPAHVRVLFYGQSIVEQCWHPLVIAGLQKRYPTVRFEVENRAIGGFESPMLIRTSETDLYPYYADLVFFNDFGRTDYVRKMIERLRARTTAEVVMWTGHIHRSENGEVDKLMKDYDQRSKDLFRIAADNRCMIVDLRRKWCRMLQDTHFAATNLLADGVHLNKKTGGLEAFANFLIEEMVRIPGTDGDPGCGTVTRHLVDFRAKGLKPDGTIDFKFDGNRVVAVIRDRRTGYYASPAKILLDGKEMSGMKELYSNTRATGIISWMPVVLNSTFETVPREETWTLTFLEGTDPRGLPVRYRVDGSVTGFDGEGVSTNDFISKSGRVRIDKGNFYGGQFDYFACKDRWANPAYKARPGMWTSWRTVANFTDRLGIYLEPRERVLLVSGCSNGPHVLTFVPVVPSRPPDIAELVVYKPAGQDEGTVERLAAPKIKKATATAGDGTGYLEME